MDEASYFIQAWLKRNLPAGKIQQERHAAAAFDIAAASRSYNFSTRSIDIL